MKYALYLFLTITITLCPPCVWAGETDAHPAGGNVFVVTNTNDSGAGSLRQAILSANASSQPGIIEFSIPGAGPHVIQPATLLPALTVPTLLDGLSQDGADCTAWPPTLQIELSGGSLTAGSALGLRLNPGSDGSVVRGLVIRGFSNDNTSVGLRIGSDDNHIQCNFIGTNAAGDASRANTRGVAIASSQSNVIGAEGSWAGRFERNLISGNTIGIMFQGNGANSNRISGNFIGTNAAGTAAIGNSTGISIGATGSGAPSENNIIGHGGGDPTLTRNVISGNSGAGISFGANTRRAHVAGNYIGLNAQGTAAIPNTAGIQDSGGGAAVPRLHHLIGWDGTPGQREAQRNVISGNSQTGVSISFFNQFGNEYAVVGNWIGTDALGDAAVPNGLWGLNLVGGSAPTRVLVHGNRIANHSGGIRLWGTSGNQHPAFWNGVDIPELPNLDSTDNCVTDNDAGITRGGGGTTVAVTFIENWWGADNGPGGSGGGSGDTIPGAVTYQPFLTEPPEHCGSIEAAPDIQVSPANIDFGDVELGTTAGPEIVTIHNVGNAAATNLLSIVGGSGFSRELWACPQHLQPGANCEIHLRFTAAETGIATGYLEIHGSGELQAEASLTANGVRLIAPDINGVLYVDQNVAAGSQSGDSWENALPELTLALEWAANEWDPADGDLQIWVAEGTYRPTGDETDLEASFVLVDGVAIYGGFAAIETALDERDWVENPTVLSGEVNGSHIYNVLFGNGVGPSTLIDGFIVTGGRATSAQGGIPALGGGMILIDSSPVISNMIFTDNRARSGGGAYMSNGSSPLFVNVLFHGNEATGQGGGGAYNNVNSHATYLNCTFYGNTAHDPMFGQGSGGGMFNWNGSSPEIVNSIFWANTADEGEDQIHGPEGGFGGFTNEARIAHSIIEGGMPENTIDNGNNLFDDPLFTDAAGGDFTLQRESPAVNAGDPDTDLSLFAGGPADPLDLAVNPRVFPGFSPIIDIGAYEFQGEPPAPNLFFEPSSLDFGPVEAGTTSDPQVATLENDGDGDATGLVFVVPDGFDADTGDCGDTLQAGQSCGITVTFSPEQAGSVDTSLDAASTEGASATIVLTGEGFDPPPILAFTPLTLDLGDVPVGQTSDPFTSTLHNSGGDATGLQLIAPGEGFEADISDCGDALPSGESCTVSVTFTPAATGLVERTMGVESGPMVALLHLSGTGVEPPLPVLVFEPPALDFDDIEIGDSSAPMHAVLHNKGGASATELDFLVPAGFSADTGDCGDTLPAGQSCQIAVTFAPSEIGTLEGTLIVGSAEDAVAELTLSGNGIEAGALSVDPDQLHFENVPVSTARIAEFTVLNTGGSDLELAAVTLESGGPAFSVHGNGCPPGTMLAPEDSCTVEISFVPDEAAQYEGAVHIAAGDGQQATVALSGFGTGNEIFDDRFERP